MDQVHAEGYGSLYIQCIFSFILLKENCKKAWTCHPDVIKLTSYECSCKAEHGTEHDRCSAAISQQRELEVAQCALRAPACVEKELRGAGKLTYDLPRAEEQARDWLFARASSFLAMAVRHRSSRA